MPRSPAHSNYISVLRHTGFLQVAVSEVPTTHHPGAISVPRGHFRYTPKTIQTSGLLLRNAPIQVDETTKWHFHAVACFSIFICPSVRSHLVSAADEAHSPVDVDVQYDQYRAGTRDTGLRLLPQFRLCQAQANGVTNDHSLARGISRVN